MYVLELHPFWSHPRIREGAADNLPDAAAELAAREILDLAERASEEDLLIALVSGGGSALLPCPPLGVTLNEKRQVCSRCYQACATIRGVRLFKCNALQVVELLARAGASIRELNTFRKALSLTKGGKLAEAAFPAKVTSLVSSRIPCGNALCMEFTWG